MTTIANPFDGRKATVPARRNEFGEWVVKFYSQGGKRHEPGDYFTNDQDDALHTAFVMVGMVPTDDQLERLRQFAQVHGLEWKRRLSDAWQTGADAQLADGHLLRQVRNQLGPTWLAQFRFSFHD